MVGIYIIENTINGKRYVGQSINIHERWNQHRYDPQPKMREDVEKYGWDAFKFDILEECPREILTERENHYIELLKPEYNAQIRGCKRLPITCKRISIALRGHTFTDDARIRMSKKRLGVRNLSPERIEKLRQKSLGNKSRSRPVKCIETDIVYPSAKKAGEALGIDPSGISANLRGVGLKAGGFTWCYPDEEPGVGSRKRNIAVICIETGERFPSIEAAARHFNINSSTLAAIMRGESISSLPYHWKPAEEEQKHNTIRDESSRKNYRPTPVFCLETDETYPSVRQAAKALGISPATIAYVLAGKVKRDCRYHFEYVGDVSQPKACVDRSKPQNIPRCRPVMCIETKERFDSMRQAAIKMGLNSAHIGNVVRGKQKSVKGFHFKEISENEM